MTLEDLREHGVLLPEEEWGEHRLETTVPEWPLAGAFLLAGVALVLTYLGDGGLLTWIAVAVFLALLLAITWICDRGVRAQRRRFRREHRAFEEDRGTDGSDPEVAGDEARPAQTTPPPDSEEV